MYSVGSAGTVAGCRRQSVSVPAYGAVVLPGFGIAPSHPRGVLGFVASDCSVAMETKTLATSWAHEK